MKKFNVIEKSRFLDEEFLGKVKGGEDSVPCNILLMPPDPPVCLTHASCCGSVDIPYKVCDIHEYWVPVCGVKYMTTTPVCTTFR